ncbi:hypothetical protein IAI18_06810 [Acetobacteraceae bacterium H6797]|nr:hypothetical protein [Acetobacteraceae bacterium H6797]
MNDTPEPDAAMTPPRRRLDPAILPILVGAGVLALALVFFFTRPPMPPPEDRFDAAGLSNRVAALEEAQRALPPRIAALESRPTGDTAGVNAGMSRLGERIAALESAATERQAAVDRRLAAAEAATGRIDRLTERQATIDAKLDSASQDQERRLSAAEGQIAQRLTAAEAQATQRVAALEQNLTTRLAAIEAREQRLAAAETRLNRVTAALAVESALDSGRPLGQALAPLGTNAPAALTRFNSEAPPTEANLRLSFEDAARAARAAMEPGTGQSVLESAASRLQGLVTIRRGDQVVMGDAAGAALERARRALEAGDLPATLGYLDTLPDPAKAAMQGWMDRARALVDARVALRGLTVGG